MLDALTKQQKRRLRELAALAHERHLARELQPLADLFDRWRSGQASPFDVSDAIHRFHQGPSRELFNFYTSSMVELVVGSPVVQGLLSDAEVADVASIIEPAVALVRERTSPA